MRERAELLGGRLEIRTGPGGSAVITRVPLANALGNGRVRAGAGAAADGSGAG
jgi:hypothetical protein